MPNFSNIFFQKLEANEVHIWSISTKNLDSEVHFNKSILSRDEVLRMESFKRSHLKGEYSFIRTNLRKILSLYLKKKPEQINFLYNQFGKPYVNGDIKFNLSHTNGIALIAVSKGNDIGIDIELIDESINILEIIKIIFTVEEIDKINRLKGTARTNEFFKLWCRKESILKGMGKGLSVDPRSIDVSTGESIRLKNKWTLIDIPIKENYKSSLAVKCNISPVKITYIKLIKDVPSLLLK